MVSCAGRGSWIFRLVAVVGGYIAFIQFREIEADAKSSIVTVTEIAETCKRYLKEIESSRDQASEIVRVMNAETAADNPEKAKQAVQNVRRNPEASLIDQAIASAVSLQQQGKTDEAIEKWLASAHITEGSDNDLAARAWFSVGYLLKDKDLKSCVLAYDKAIRLSPDAGAYNNRGVAKGHLNQYEEAIADFDEAIRLSPDAGAYNNRGLAKGALNQRKEAFADFDEAIRLDPDYAGAYLNRGIAKLKLQIKDEMRKDFEITLELARNANNAKIVAEAEQALRDLNAPEDS